MSVELPSPSPEETAHSERLAAVIRAEIAASGGAIDFSRYMELALYAPGLGYYSAGAAKFGAGGDFVTAPVLGSIFAGCLARAIAPILRETGGDVFELGPGTGALAADVLIALERLDAIPKNYCLLERSADLRERQFDTLHTRCPRLASRARWLDRPAPEAWNGALIANEVVDALPVRLFSIGERGAVSARHVTVDSQGAFAWRDIPADALLTEQVDKLVGIGREELPIPYRSEICTMLAPWLQEVTRSLRHGAAWFIDYGYRRADFYSAQRSSGTLRCYRRHRAHADPLVLPGLQDITASVDFDALSQAAVAAKWRVESCTSQAEFLAAHGIDSIFADASLEADASGTYRLAQEVKRLMLPGAMGEVFKVLQLSREP